MNCKNLTLRQKSTSALEYTFSIQPAKAKKPPAQSVLRRRLKVLLIRNNQKD
jgi:hypothetical protein